ncbi:hypothetical protein ANAPH1_00893 [Anaplasma phagocytophilum]|nr:hypothetical protein ANAPH1_00893 [Anaplasma phagocytophilum]
MRYMQQTFSFFKCDISCDEKSCARFDIDGPMSVCCSLARVDNILVNISVLHKLR